MPITLSTLTQGNRAEFESRGWPGKGETETGDVLFEVYVIRLKFRDLICLLPLSIQYRRCLLKMASVHNFSSCRSMRLNFLKTISMSVGCSFCMPHAALLCFRFSLTAIEWVYEYLGICPYFRFRYARSILPSVTSLCSDRK